MSSRFEEILQANSKRASLSWEKFVRRDKSAYKSEQESWGALAYGYKAAADIVAKNQIDSCRHRDILFAPILFLYRHYMELELKHTRQELYDRGLISVPVKKRTHNLARLWLDIEKAIIDYRILMDDDPFIVQIRKNVMLIDNCDQNSECSRYPIVNNQHHSIYVDIEEFVCAADNFETLIYALHENEKLRYEVEL